MKKLLFLFIMLAYTGLAAAQPFIAEGRFPLAVIPSSVEGTSICNQSLNGTWEINMNPSPEVWKTGEGAWKRVQVPGEPAMQGYRVTNDREFFYRTRILIPESARGKTVLIRFNGVYSHARVFAGGQYIREHFGGFTAWDADITPVCKPGDWLTVYVGVTDRADDISYASGYAHHPIGGILREVRMLVVPHDYLNRLYINTNLDPGYGGATVSVVAAKKLASGGSQLRISLTGPDGKPVPGSATELRFRTDGTAEGSFSVSQPQLWNQEVPVLYTLKAELVADGRVTQAAAQPVGFREVRVDGKRLLVNGDPVKLAGACRHDIHPRMGRSTNRYYDSLDVVLAREANLNFIRTSHYPPSPDFLEFADRYGLYVQEETAICFVNDWRVGVYHDLGGTFDKPEFTSRYLGQLSEMIDRDRNHPCVIMWSIGNESTYGINFQKSYDFVKSVDLTRPVSWTWPATALSKGKRCFDIAVAHYPSYDGKDNENFGLKYSEMEHSDFPLLSDEWAHVPCYNLTLLREDPNVKDFWGRSLDTMWSGRFDVPGNLGGAIWGMTDEVFHLPDTVTGYGPWGFIDVWRRKKAEFWNTRKSYSPVRVRSVDWKISEGGSVATVSVQNRFNHTSLNDIRMVVTHQGTPQRVRLPDTPPHGIAKVDVSVPDSRPVEFLIEFYQGFRLLDEERVRVPAPAGLIGSGSATAWTQKRSGAVLELTSGVCEVRIDERNGTLLSAGTGGKEILTGAVRVVINRPKDPGGFKDSEGIWSGPLAIATADLREEGPGCLVVKQTGTAGGYPVMLTVRYHADGRIEAEYEADSVPKYTWQLGLAFPVSERGNRISWQRAGYWSTYPEGHLSANAGVADRFTGVTERYRESPGYSVAEGMHDYYLSGAILPDNAWMNGSEAFRGVKENIWSYSLGSGDTELLGVRSNGKQSAKMNCPVNASQELMVLDKVDYWTLSWGNYQGTANAPGRFAGKAELRMR